MKKIVTESLNEMEFGKVGKLKRHIAKRMDELELSLSKDESNMVANARLEELVFIMDMMDWDLTPAR